MFTAPATSHWSTSSSSGDLGPPEATGEGQGRSSYTSDDRITHVSYAPASSSVDHDSYIAAADRLGKNQDGHPPQVLKYLESSSDSEDDGRASSLMLTVDPLAVEQFETPEFNHEEHEEFKGFRGFLKKSVKELRKGKSVSQFRRKVIINSHAVPDIVVKKAEDLAGPIHPGSYWYDFISILLPIILQHLAGHKKEKSCLGLRIKVKLYVAYDRLAMKLTIKFICEEENHSLWVSASSKQKRA
jgi:hypothetical protein